MTKRILLVVVVVVFLLSLPLEVKMDYYYYYSIFHVNKTENTAVSAIEIRKVCEQTKVFKRAIGIRIRHNTRINRPYISDEKWA